MYNFTTKTPTITSYLEVTVKQKGKWFCIVLRTYHITQDSMYQKSCDNPAHSTILYIKYNFSPQPVFPIGTTSCVTSVIIISFMMKLITNITPIKFIITVCHGCKFSNCAVILEIYKQKHNVLAQRNCQNLIKPCCNNCSILSSAFLWCFHWSVSLLILSLVANSLTYSTIKHY